MDPLIASIILFAGNFAPRGWAFCQGQLLSIAQNTPLFALIGTTYGGNGQTTFALPDLRGRVPVGVGTGTGLPAVNLGQVGGVPSVTLTVNQMPQHNHNLNVSSGDGDSRTPAGTVLAKEAAGVTASYKTGTSVDGTLSNNSIGVAGGSQPVDIRQPYLGLNYIIAVEGVFPSRN